MSDVIHISSAQNPRIKALLRLRRQRHRSEQGLLIAEGLRQIRRAIDARLTITQLYYCPQICPVTQLPDIHPEAQRFELTESVMGKASYRQNPQGVLAVCKQPDYVGAGIDGLQPKVDAPALWLIADAMTKPGNLGAMARTASASGCAAMFVADAVVDPFNPNAIRASTGAVFSLPVISATAQQIQQFLIRHRIRVYAADPGATLQWTDAELTGDIALVIGAEHTGLKPHWRRCARETGGDAISIPMQTGPIDSLNASTTAAVVLFEAIRQRRLNL